MPIQHYGVIRGKITRYTPGSTLSPHFRIILVDDNNTEYQVDVNVCSRDGSEVLYHASEDFQSTITQKLLSLRPGITPLAATANSGALDYLREALFDTNSMEPLPINGPSHNDLNTFIQAVVESARTSGASVFVFGQYFNDSGRTALRDGNEGLPSQGIHDVHMNQGNGQPFHQANGTYQDGGIIIYFPAEQKWVATFLAFQTQAFQTDEQGNPIGPSWAEEHGGET